MSPVIENFLIKHIDQVAQSVDRPKEYVLTEIGQKDKVGELLERFRTKILVLEKNEGEYFPGAKRVILEASETLAYESAMPLIRALKQDSRCASICLLTDNAAQNRFRDQKEFYFQEVNPKGSLFDTVINQGPYDISFAMVDAKNSFNSVLLFGGKSALGSGKLYFISTGWQGVGSTGFFETGRRENMDEIDGYFTNNELARQILLHDLPDVDQERVFDFGTPYSDTVEQEQAANFSRLGREKLGLGFETLTVLYAGDKSFAYKDRGGSPRINEVTFEKTLDVMIRLAEQNPNRSFALLVRPHPGDINKDELFQIAGSREKPVNLSVIPASREIVSMQEAGYAADVLVGIGGTELFMEPLRGRKSVFLSFEGRGLGGEMITQDFSTETLAIIKKDPNCTIAKSPEELAEFVGKCQPTRDEPKVGVASHQKSATERILDMALS